MPKSRESAYKFTEHPNVANYDWRLAVATTLAEPVLGAAGVLHEAGAPFVAFCPIKYDSKTSIQFNMPSVCGLLLDYANRLWVECNDAQALFTESLPNGAFTVKNDADLMFFLEKRMAIVVFAYTAIEAFTNEIIEEAYTKASYTYSEPNPKTGTAYTLEEIERYMDLETKLCGVLPEITKIKNPKGTAVWQTFGQMRKIRHFIIHPKLADKIQSSPDAQVLWKMLTDSAFRNFAVGAKDLMMHYAGAGAHPARWLFKCPF